MRIIYSLSQINKPLRIFIFLLTVNILIWLILVPIWHTPDEQAHFGQTAFVAIKERNPKYKESPDLTKEIYVSEILLGTARDKSGNNKFTFHPEYKIAYSNNLYGIYEASISALARASDAQQFDHTEASRYPIFYYIPAAIIYKILINSDLFTRVYAVRFWSSALFLTNIFVIYLIGGLITENKWFGVSLAMMSALHPMMTFANIGVTSDALGNLLFSLLLYFNIKIITTYNFSPKLFVRYILTGLFTVINKPQFIVMIPVIGATLLYISVKAGKLKYFAIGVMVLGLIYILYKFNHILIYIDVANLVKYTREYTLSHTYREVLPWFWGVYKWLGVTYPRTVHRLINLISCLSILGFLKWIYLAVKYQRWKKKKTVMIIFGLNLIAFLYFVGISYYDWYLWYISGYQLGVQGRYFFPIISITFMDLLIGWQQLWPQNYKIWAVKLLVILMLMLNLFALYTVANTYYDISSLTTFIIQASQYKPEIFKGINLALLLLIYVISVVLFVYTYLKQKSSKINPIL